MGSEDIQHNISQPACQTSAHEYGMIQELRRILQKFYPDPSRAGEGGLLLADYYDAETKTLLLPAPAGRQLEITDTEIAAFSCIEHIKGNLTLQGFHDISALRGLDNLKTVSGDLILSATTLERIEGFNALLSVGGNLSVVANPRLKTLSAFTSLECVSGRLQIEKNQKLEQIEGFSTLHVIEKNSLEIINNASLKNVIGFDQLESIGTSLVIDLCPKLADIKFLTGLKFARNILIHKTPVPDPSPLRNIISHNQEFRGFIKITSCALPTVSFLKGLRSVGSSLFLHNNRLKNLHGLEELTQVDGSLSISGNRLRDIQPLAHLQEIDGMLGLANNQLASLHGLENLRKVTVVKWSNIYRSISIHGNPFLQDIQALEQLQPEGGHLIVTADNREYQVKPKAGSPFCQNTFDVIEFPSQNTIPSSFLCGKPSAREETPTTRKIKILFANGWYNALNNCRWLAPYFNNFASVDEVVLFCKKYGITSILANIYRAQLFLADHENELKRYGLQFLAGNKEVLDCMIHKKHFTEFMQKENFSQYIPQLYLSAADIRFPCIVKPKMGGAGRGIRLVYFPDSLGEVGEESEVFEYTLGNEEYASSLLYKDGVLLKHITYRKIFRKDYYIFQEETPATITVKRCETPFVDLFNQILDRFHQGKGNCTCSFNYKIENGIPKIFEVNPRLGYTLACHPSDFREMVEAYLNAAATDGISTITS